MFLIEVRLKEICPLAFLTTCKEKCEEKIFYLIPGCLCSWYQCLSPVTLKKNGYCSFDRRETSLVGEKTGVFFNRKQSETSSALLLPLQGEKMNHLLACWQLGAAETVQQSSGTRSEAEGREERVVGQIKQVQLRLPPYSALKKYSWTRVCLAHSSLTLAIDLLSPFHLAGITILLHKHQKNPEGSSLEWNQ